MNFSALWFWCNSIFFFSNPTTPTNISPLYVKLMLKLYFGNFIQLLKSTFQLEFHCLLSLQTHTRSVRKVSDRIFLCEHLMDYNLARLHEPTLNLSAHA